MKKTAKNQIVNNATEVAVVEAVATATVEEVIATEVETVVEAAAAEIVEEMPMEAFIAAATGAIEPVKEKRVTIADEIMALANSGMSRVAIHKQLQAKHPKINYRYVVQTLLKAKAAGVEINVPRQERVFAPKPDAIEALEAKLAKMKAAAAAVVNMAENELPEVPEVPEA